MSFTSKSLPETETGTVEKSRSPVASEQTMRCPTCRARQPWSDCCRRCKCDLSWLRQVHDVGERLRRASLLHLRDGRADRALYYARRYRSLVQDADSARLLAVCHLTNGHWQAALTVARSAGE